MYGLFRLALRHYHSPDWWTAAFCCIWLDQCVCHAADVSFLRHCSFISVCATPSQCRQRQLSTSTAVCRLAPYSLALTVHHWYSPIETSSIMPGISFFFLIEAQWHLEKGERKPCWQVDRKEGEFYGGCYVTSHQCISFVIVPLAIFHYELPVPHKVAHSFSLCLVINESGASEFVYDSTVSLFSGLWILREKFLCQS